MKQLFALNVIVLSVGFSQAGEYDDSSRMYIESALDKNYNVQFVIMNFGNKRSEKKLQFSWDFMYFRVIKDSSTWRLSAIPLIYSEICFVGLRDSKDWWALIPSMLMNPTLAFPLTSSGAVSMGIGYNTDFIALPNLQVYFAPKVQTEWLFPSGLGIATIVSYQIFDCFATKHGVKFGLSLFMQYTQ
jgi:hypothetical protein